VNLDQFTSAQKNINAAIQEYLLRYGYSATVQTMQEEMADSRGLGKNFVQDDQEAIQYMG
jgi:hypothetical protein